MPEASLFFVTGNTGKFAEVKALVPQVRRLDLDLVEVQAFEARAIVGAKLAEARKHCEGALLVEDTSLYFDALNGLPGPFVKWFLERLGDTGLAAIADRLENDRAVARTVLGFSDAAGEVAFFEGSVPGRIVAPRGSGGFGWDRLFVPDGSERTFGEMEASEKQAFSMRRLAVEGFLASAVAGPWCAPA